MTLPSAARFAGRRPKSNAYGSCADRARRPYGPRSGQPTGVLPCNWRDRLPDCETYYRRHVDGLSRPNGAGFARGVCPFHNDHSPSLSVSLAGRGLWKCFACGEHGDLVRFHERITGLSFTAAVRDLLGRGRCS